MSCCNKRKRRVAQQGRVCIAKFEGTSYYKGGCDSQKKRTSYQNKETLPQKRSVLSTKRKLGIPLKKRIVLSTKRRLGIPPQKCTC